MNRIVLFWCLMVAGLPAASWAQTNPHGNDSLDCASCHDEASWSAAEKAARFDHRTTGFPLVGRHVDVACRTCHRDLVFARIGTACVDCHADPHRLRLGTDCASCHTPDGWVARDEARRRHDATRLPLTGVHERLDCDACHRDPTGSDFANTPSDCYACHAADYAATTTPPHATSGFGTDCVTCHGVFTASWGRGDFQHSARFPLTGAHASTTCASCHVSGFVGTPSDCVACHRGDYDRTTDPSHTAAGFSTDCTACHTTNGWDGATFDHDASGFPLTGRHRAITCLECHASGYSGTPTDCYTCHQGDYDGTSDPAHAGAGFPTSCVDCHTTGGWTPSTWNHDALFPIYSGQHRNEWNVCADCHTVPANYAVFECIFCHEHSRTRTDSEHREVSGYQYLSTACFECHPRGTGDK